MSQIRDQRRFLQYRKWQLIGMSQWCRSALCGHPLPALTDNWTQSAASRHTIAPINHTRHSPRSRSYYSFSVPLRVGGELAWAHSKLATFSRWLAVDQVWVEPATSRLQVGYFTTTPLHLLSIWWMWVHSQENLANFIGFSLHVKFRKRFGKSIEEISYCEKTLS